MHPDQIASTYQLQADYFFEGHTRTYEFRVQQLKNLRAAIKAHEEEILEALYRDMRKPRFEAYTSEIGILYEEIDYTLKHLKDWMKPRKVSTPAVHFPSSSRILPEPKGIVLIIGPWNYPFQLVIAPLIGAIAAGNTAFVKPSELAPATAEVVEKVLGGTYADSFIKVVQGNGAEVVPALMDAVKFDHIFFTGSVPVGKIIASEAGKKLTPVTLELGGKSPAIVDRETDIDITAKRIVWAKFFNAGQTCVSPDYLLVHHRVKDKLISKMKEHIHAFFGDNPQTSESYARIINKRRFEALTTYLEEGNILIGGETDPEDLYIAPTLLDDVTLEDAIMQEEIFGPILPVITWHTLPEAIQIVRQNPSPLALYVFTTRAKTEKTIIEQIPFGGGCINNTMVHLANPELPFGGIGTSGQGSYHGEESFRVFSHFKSLLKTKFYYDNPLRYPPYTDRKTDIAQIVFD